MKRIATGLLIISSVLIPAVVLGRAGSAQADPRSAARQPAATPAVPAKPAAPPVSAGPLPLTVLVSSRTLTVTGTVLPSSPAPTTTTRASSTGSVSLWFRYPGAAAPTRVGEATSRRAGTLAVTADRDAARIVMGVNTIQVRRDADGPNAAAGAPTGQVQLDIRRISRVALTVTAPAPNGTATGTAPTTATGAGPTPATISLAVRVTHYDPKTAKFIRSRLSPVRIQEKVAGAWVTVARASTDLRGLASVQLVAATGPHTYRAVRPNGATVWGATSAAISAS